jgi:putative hydrolase of the HAD superfamily
MARAIDAVLLDLGNVLVFHDDLELFARIAAFGAVTAAGARDALAPLWQRFHVGELAGDALRSAVCGIAGRELGEREFLALWNSHFRIHDEVLPLVEGLLGRVKLLLLSNTEAFHFEHLRPRLPILSRFDGLVVSHEVGLAKPDPEIFREALRRAGTRPEATAYFDDVPRYVEASRALGIEGRVFSDAAAFRRDLRELGLTS